MPTGASSSTPAALARIPVTISTVCRGSPARAGRSPSTASAAPSSANRWAGCGAAGRPDRAVTIGRRAAERAGHHEAASAVRIASPAPASTAHHGIESRSMRCPTTCSNAGRKANHTASPRTVPMVAPTAPAAAPLASITRRTWRSVAPIAAIMPSARWRRRAITVKPAAASSPMKASPIVASSSTASAWLRCCCAALAPLDMTPWTSPPGGRKPLAADPPASVSSVSPDGGRELPRRDQRELVRQVLRVLHDPDDAQHPPVRPSSRRRSSG